MNDIDRRGQTPPPVVKHLVVAALTILLLAGCVAALGVLLRALHWAVG